MEQDAYEGWKNYETWCVSLWIDNEQTSYEYWREEARRHQGEAPTSRNVQDCIWTASQAVRFGLADQLRDEITDAAPAADPSVYSDLLMAALQEVNWNEIAEAIVAELNPSDD